MGIGGVTAAPGEQDRYPDVPSGELAGDALQTAWDMALDDSVLHHGYTASLRDYEFVVQHFDRWRAISAASRFVLKHYVEVDVRSLLSVVNWEMSMSDANLDSNRWRENPEGHLWEEWQDLYPGGMVVPDSPRAKLWSDALGTPFHEIVVETNVQRIVLVFSTMSVIPVSLPTPPRVGTA